MITVFQNILNLNLKTEGFLEIHSSPWILEIIFQNASKYLEQDFFDNGHFSDNVWHRRRRGVYRGT